MAYTSGHFELEKIRKNEQLKKLEVLINGTRFKAGFL